MKKIAIYIGSFLFIMLNVAFFIPKESKLTEPEKITFFSGDFKQARLQAKKEKKPIFIDFYATWCGSCKQLSSKTLTNKEVINILNQNYINMAIDVDTEEGAKMAQWYKVTAIPTLVIVDENGKVMKQTVGFLTSKQFLNFASIPTK
ncbi:MAG: thioredoxin family protein [Chitinophagaceae bacterium]|jgi:thioredoxin 1